MHAPAFWDETGGLARLLAPAGAVVAAAGRLRTRLARPVAPPVPLICVGNVSVGGTGKTPVVLDLLERLQAGGVQAHGLARGYGGSARGPLRVDLARHAASEVGDEALLLAEVAPAWVARDRVAGARAAAAAGAAGIVLDDGLQYPHLDKSLSLLVIDGERGLMNGRLLPAGPLREPLQAALARVRAVVLMGRDETGLAAELARRRPVLEARLAVPEAEAAALRGRAVFAFAGIGRPQKLFASLEAAGARLVERRSFADHHPYRRGEIEAMLARARAQDALPVTTAKDAARLPAELRAAVHVLPVRAQWREPRRLEALLTELWPEAAFRG